MRLDDAVQGVTRLFLDTSAVVYYVERNPNYVSLVDPIFDRIEREMLPAVTSVVTLAECLVVPLRLGQRGVVQDFTDLVVRGRGVVFITLDAGLGHRAAELRAVHNLSLMDALQFAAALGAGCDAFLTNDVRLKRVQEIGVLILDELEV